METIVAKKERNLKDVKKKISKESSKAALFLKKYPNGIGEIIDMKAVLK